MGYSKTKYLIAFLLKGLTLSTTAQQIRTPNILLIMTDQHSWDAVGYAGNKAIKTPNLDRLASEGVNFSQAITACPVSAPARTSIMTGRLTESTTIRRNSDVEKGICNYPTFDEILTKSGYKSEYWGKFHAPERMARIYQNPPVEGMRGTEPIVDWEPIYVRYLQKNIKKRALNKGELYETSFYGGTIPYKPDPIDDLYEQATAGNIPVDMGLKTISQATVHGKLDLPKEHTITAVQGRQTIEALERLKDDQFILTASFHCPHVPITPSEPYASLYKAKEMETPLSITDKRENSPYQPGKILRPYNDKEKVQYMVANYYAFVTEVDVWVGKILNKLDDLGLRENTLVVFVSDHGEMLGAHGMRGKFNFYEESVRVPFIMRYPGHITAGKKLSNPVSILNIFPTILDYVGINNIPSDGYSLKELIEGKGGAKYDFAVSEWNWMDENVPSIMIRTNEWKLMTTHREGGKNIEALFDLKNDPHELNNLLGSNPERFKYQSKAEELRTKLVEYLLDVKSPLKEGVAARELVRQKQAPK
ncbi:MAG: sulfatase-like hydrolase/transferase [Bacteroidales bacterium]|nr:sulfatase-like hydrolase/transferase [Bacteroidales bacterium]